MPKQSLAHVRRTTKRRYRPSLAQPTETGAQFESVEACEIEDRLRQRSITRAARLGTQARLYDADRARRLAARLNYKAGSRRPPRSLCCSLYMRRVRDRIFSHLYLLTATSRHRVTTFTAVKRGWEFSPEQLLAVDPDKLLCGFLSDLNRRGASEADGWLIGFMHGEYETPEGIFRLHLHGIVAGGMINVLDRLRNGPNYNHRPGDNVRFRLRIARKRLSNLPYSLAYCLKSYWPWKHVVDSPHGRRRTRRHKRIPEPYHTLVLLFLDHHSINDLVVMKHLRVAGGGLSLSADRRAYER